MNLFFYFIFQKPYFFIPVGYPVNLAPIMGKMTLSPQPCSGPFILNQVLVCFLLYFFLYFQFSLMKEIVSQR